MMERPCRSNSLAWAYTDSAPSPVITEMREAKGFMRSLFHRGGRDRRGGNTQRIDKTWKELERRCRRRQLDQLLGVVRRLQLRKQSVIDGSAGLVKAFRKAETQLLGVGEWTGLEVRL